MFFKITNLLSSGNIFIIPTKYLIDILTLQSLRHEVYTDVQVWVMWCGWVLISSLKMYSKLSF